MKPPDFLDPRTTPEEALLISHAWGAALNAKGLPLLELATELGRWVNIPFGHSPVRRYLRIGFSAGYLGLPVPKAARVLARCEAGAAARVRSDG